MIKKEKRPYYMAIRNHTGDEILGVVVTEGWKLGSGVGISKALLDNLDKVIHEDWWFDNISKAEFETYQAFGIKEFEV